MKKTVSALLTAILLILTLASCVQDTVPPPNNVSAADSTPDETSQPLAPITPEPFQSKAVTVDKETGLPILPTLAERANEEYVRSHAGGMDWTYEELIAMTPAEINEKLMQPAFEHYWYFDGLGVGLGSEKVDFWDTEDEYKTSMYAVVSHEDFPTYESFVCETRKYFSSELAAECFGNGGFMEYGEVFYAFDGVRGTDIDYCTIDFSILSSSETEIKYRGVARYYLYEEDWGTYPETSLPDYRFEFRYFDYTLSLQDGRWVFTQFELPY